jgi:phosphatidylglycerophosphatase A
MNETAISSSASQRTPWAWAVATFFGSGLLRPGPGSWASGFVALMWYFSVRNSDSFFAHISAAAAAVLTTVIGIPAATIVARESQKKDPGFVVIDEVAGQLLPLTLAPANWKYLFASFILFRCFDIFKPPPVRQLEALPEGTGIVLDDIGAGLYALLVLFLLLHFKLL